MAESEFTCSFIWIISERGVEVYDDECKVLDAVGETATLEDGRTISRGDIVRVIAFADADMVYRGAKAVLRSGAEVPLVTDVSVAAEYSFGYSRNDLLWETGWAPTLAVAVANWAGADYVDLI
jgi:hypothetical protein